MATPLEKRERQDRILAELSELGLALARDLQACALAADEASAKADLSLAFQRTSRSVRQTLALEARFDRDRLAAEHEAHDIARRAEAFRVARRKARVKLGVERCIWDEAEDDEAEALLADLDDRLERDALADLFAGDDPSRPTSPASAPNSASTPRKPWPPAGPSRPASPTKAPPTRPSSDEAPAEQTSPPPPNLSSRTAEEPIRDPGANAMRPPLGPGSPLRYGRDDSWGVR